jgi:hypothetical protein
LIGSLEKAVPNVFAFGLNGTTVSLANLGTVKGPTQFQVSTSIIKVNNAVNSSIATALGIIPLASPASGVIFETDPLTGAEVPSASTLGTVFTERAETIGKRKWYFGVSHEDFHFTSLNGQSLNNLTLLYPGGTPSGVTNLTASQAPLTSFPATFRVGMDVRLSQSVAFITYGVTDNFDFSVGLPMVHSAVAARTYEGVIYDGDGAAGQTGATAANPNCWCAGTFNPGALITGAKSAANFTQPEIGQASLGKTGFGDLLLRGKGVVLKTNRVVVAVGADLRFATGDAKNYLGTGTTSVKPFLAISLYSKPLPHNIVFAPHLNFGWQFSGKSILGGELQPATSTVSMTDGSGSVTYAGAPLTASKGYLPDVLSWAAGSEIALGHRNTFIVDILGNQIGSIHGVPYLAVGTASGFSPSTLKAVDVQGLIGGTGSSAFTTYSQVSGAFGYKARLIGKLVFTFNALVRFDNNGLTARFSPLYGLGYSF